MTIREPFNAISHLLSAILAAVGGSYLVLTHRDDPLAWIGFLIAGIVAVLMFGASGTYHWAPDDKLFLRKFDHSAIYLMIAGSMTPVCLMAMPRELGIGMLVAQWTLAAIGIVSTFKMEKPPTWIRLTLYLAMGWGLMPLLPFMRDTLPSNALPWLFAGGAVYTVGAVVYASKRPTLWPGKFGFHELWHLFVTAGAACHFVMMTRLT